MTIKKWVRSSGLLLVGCVMLGGCNNQGTEGELNAVEILIDWKAEPTYAGFYVAKELGYYSDQGFRVTIQEGSGAPVSVRLISQGEYLIGSASGAATAIGRSRGLDVVSLAVYYPNIPTVIYSLEDDSITTPEDLEGKTIGINYQSINYQEYRALARRTNMSRDNIEEVGVGFEVAPLLNDKVDALLNYTELTPVELRNRGYQVNELRLADYGVKAYSLNLITAREALGSRAEMIRKLQKATTAGYKFVASKPDSASQIFLDLFPARDSAFVFNSMKKVADQLGRRDVVGCQSTSGWERTITMLESLELLEGPVQSNEIVTEQSVICERQ